MTETEERRLRPMRIGGRTFEWGTRTYVMGIVNVTPDSFSGDGLLRAEAALHTPELATEWALAPEWQNATAPQLAVQAALWMADEGADIVDVGGESTRPGHVAVSAEEETARVVPAIAAIHAAIPDLPISIDTSKPEVAAAALDAGAALLNDVWGVSQDDGMARLAAERGVPLVLMHNRAEASYDDVVAEVVADLARAVERAERAGLPRERIIVDPGFGFGKTPEHNLVVLRELRALGVLGCPLLIGTSRKSTLGKVLGGLPPEERVEATVATTALAIAAGVDVVRVHDVLANVRAARISDAIVRGA